MADESKTADTIPVTPATTSDPDTMTAVLEHPTAHTSAPAMHGDELWGGPRWIENATSEPVFVRTKDEYWALMRKTGHRMKDQQESTTGAAQSLDEVAEEIRQAAAAAAPPPRVVPPLLQNEAHIYGAMKAVLKAHGLIETLWCEHCFSLGRHHGCRSIVNAKEVLIECRCGLARYQPPTGTTDLDLGRLANIARTELDKTIGRVETQFGRRTIATELLHDSEAKIIGAYVAALSARLIEPRLFHASCWGHRVSDEDDACGLKVTHDQVVIVCKCRKLFAQRTKVVH